MPALPTGTVTFLFSDIEGSTRIVQELGSRYPEILATHGELIQGAVVSAGGTKVSTSGDGVFAVFPEAGHAIEAAADTQRRISAEPWPENGTVRVRIGLHTGEGLLGGDNYVGLDVHRAARITAAGHGGQVLVSGSTRALVGEIPLPDLELRDLGEHRLKDLNRPEHLFQLVVGGLRTDFPPLRTDGGVPTELPLLLTSFVGRPEVDQVAGALEGTRLLTLTGPGGTGKTRLSVQTAFAVKDRFPDGVVFVDLASLSEPELLPSALATALSLEQLPGSPAEKVAAHLRARRMLLVLDNFEQLLDGAGYVTSLLQSAPNSSILVTSRAALRVSGEQEFPVPHLALPEPNRHYLPEEAAELASVALFVDRATASRPDFLITPDNVDAIVEIVNRLDGLPLAIELAASRVKLLTPEAIAQRLRDGSGFSLLEAGRRDLPARQQTLRAAIGWSYQLLEEPERLVYQRLSVFMGGAGLEQIEEVCGGPEGRDVLSALGVLVEHSLVRQEGVGGEPRFRMLETIRQFAAEQLSSGGEESEVRRRHALAFLELAEKAAPHLIAWDQKRWLDRLELDHDNLRSALTWAVDQGEANLAMKLAFAMWRFWQVRGHLIEAEDRFRRVLAVPGADPLIRAKALEGAGGIHWWRGQTEECERAYRESLELMEAHGDLAAIANARYNLALTLSFDAGYDVAMEMLHRAHAEAIEAGDERLVAWTTWGLGDVSVFSDNPNDTKRYSQEALELFRKLDDPFGIGWSSFMAAFGAIGSGLTEEARSLLQEGIKLFAGFSDISALTLHLNSLGISEVQAGRTQRGARLLAAARRLRDVSGTGMLDLNDIMLAEYTSMPGLDEARALLTDEAHAEAVADGLAMSQEEAISYALSDED